MKSDAAKMNLVGRYLNGEASLGEVAELETLMREDQQLRTEFLACARVDSALPGAIGGDTELLELAQANPPKPAAFLWQLWLPAAAALVMLGMILSSSLGLWKKSQSKPLEVARFGELTNCRWVDSEAKFSVGDVIRKGQRIELSAGIAEITFRTGARLELVGPAILETRSENSGFLTLGEVHLVAETPESKGFTIETPISKFIDIGTAFTATVSPDGLSRLDVSEGEVDVVVDGIEPRRFKRGETLYVEPGRKRIMTRIEPGDGTAAFRFPTIAPPSRLDYADQTSGHATIRVVRGQLRAQAASSGPASVLLDGSGQSQQDAPQQSAFFKTRNQGRFLIDLGQSIAISKINSYSWHQHNQIEEHRERARQRFTLYGFSGDELPDLDQPLENSKWTRIARVNSDEFFRVNTRLDRPAQQACSISAPQGEIGHFRYLLWDMKGNSFYGEFDVFGAPQLSETPIE